MSVLCLCLPCYHYSDLVYMTPYPFQCVQHLIIFKLTLYIVKISQQMPSALSKAFLGMEVKKENKTKQQTAVRPFKRQQSRQLAKMTRIHSSPSGSDSTKRTGVRSQRNLRPTVSLSTCASSQNSHPAPTLNFPGQGAKASCPFL